MSRELVAVDLGGTNARFAIATVDGGKVVDLGEPVTLQTADYASFQTAWQAFGAKVGRDLPDAAALEEWFRFLATACPECGVIDDPVWSGPTP